MIFRLKAEESVTGETGHGLESTDQVGDRARRGRRGARGARAARGGDLCLGAGRGMRAAEAERRVASRSTPGPPNPALLRRRPTRDAAIEPPAGSASPFAAIAQDTRYAWRLLRRQPAYAALVIATMALGIAATTVLGSVAYGVLLKPLPWADAPRLVRLYETRQGSTRRFRPMMTNATYVEWRRRPATLDAIGAWSIADDTVGSDGAERITVAEVTPSLLPMLQARPALGRTFVPGDEEPGRPPLDPALARPLATALRRTSRRRRTDACGSTPHVHDHRRHACGLRVSRQGHAGVDAVPHPSGRDARQRGILALDVPGDRPAARRRHAGAGRGRRHGPRRGPRRRTRRSRWRCSAATVRPRSPPCRCSRR